ncbi:kinase-like protein [Athelia psychrophila]|uniref:Kinase-like protein n=1 Tax=Athelia psychrophila TaxID=1759441 RepID=A0A166E5P3_9AGAM|nr:kinase-like protein [Fibularhizoctonia sp. CBS 109695]
MIREGLLNTFFDRDPKLESITDNSNVNTLLRQNGKSFPGSEKGNESGPSALGGSSQFGGETSLQEGADDWIDNVELDPLIGPYHALDTINKYLLETTPQAQVALSHESDWWDLSPDSPVASLVYVASLVSNVASLVYSDEQFMASIRTEPILQIGALEPKDLTSEIKLDDPYFAYGGYSEVYGGDWTDASTGRVTRVAIKALRGVTNDEESLQKIKKRLLREIGVWEQLDHPNITPFLGVVSGFGPLPAMVSPYYSEANINQYTLDNPDADRLPLILGVARGLAYLHSLGLLHGDLKGHNVLIDDNLSPRLADFGPSRIVGRRGFITAFTGTGRYMAPELTVINDDIPYLPQTADSSEDDMLSGETATLDPIITKKSDIYAFAMVVIEILTSKQPFFYYRQEHLVVILTQDGKRPDRPRCLPTHFSDEIWQLMEECWHHDPQVRPEMAAVVSRLEEMQSKKLRVSWEE